MYLTPIYSGHYFGVLMVSAVERFHCITFSVEVNPRILLETETSQVNNLMHTVVVRKEAKIPTH